jgi:hypothetical protein
MKHKKLLTAVFSMIILTGFLILYSCNQENFEGNERQMSTSDPQSYAVSSLSVDQPTTVESRIDQTTKVKMEITRLSDGTVNIKKWIIPIPADDLLDYYTFIFGGEIINYDGNTLSINLPADKQFKRVLYDQLENQAEDVPIDGYDYTCECCAGPDNGGTPNTGGLGMCMVVHGPHPQGGIVINCYSKGCTTGCGLNSTKINGTGGGGTKKPSSELIIDASFVNVQVMQ